MTLYGAVEAGGTKFVCAVGTGPDDLRDELRFPTTSPRETLARAVDYFKTARNQYGPLAAVGVGSFGPVDLDVLSPTWGYVTATPKPGWADTPVASVFSDALDLPVGFDTDVNGAVLAEHRWGAGRGLDDLVYITVGTGIGAGVLSGGKLVHGLLHPEAGHLLLPRHPSDGFGGSCPFHGTCLEGLASGPAIAKRWGTPAAELSPDHAAWALEAHYLALGVHSLLSVLSPSKIILGGGVMEQTQLFPLVRAKLIELNAGYLRHRALASDAYVVPTGLGNRSGILGALALAETALSGK